MNGTKNETTIKKKNQKMEICNVTYFQCSSWCQSSKLRLAHGKDRGEVPYQPSKTKQQRKKSNNGNTRRAINVKLAST